MKVIGMIEKKVKLISLVQKTKIVEATMSIAATVISAKIEGAKSKKEVVRDMIDTKTEMRGGVLIETMTIEEIMEEVETNTSIDNRDQEKIT